MTSTDKLVMRRMFSPPACAQGCLCRMTTIRALGSCQLAGACSKALWAPNMRPWPAAHGRGGRAPGPAAAAGGAQVRGRGTAGAAGGGRCTRQVCLQGASHIAVAVHGERLAACAHQHVCMMLQTCRMSCIWCDVQGIRG